MLSLSIRRVLALALLLIVIGCGGGGSTEAAGGSFNASFAPASLEVSGVAGTPVAANVQATLSLSYEGDGDIWLVMRGGESFILDVVAEWIDAAVLQMKVTMRGDLAVGTHKTELQLLACLDEQCSQVIGRPAKLPITYQVKPNIGIQNQVSLVRTGWDPAPSAILPATIPTDAGVLAMQVVTDRPGTFDLRFDGTAIQVLTAQVPSGTYTATATLQSTTDVRYSATVEISYTVLPPPEGEHPLSVSDNDRTVALWPGEVRTERLAVTRPTWTDAWDSPQVWADSPNLLTLVDLGNDQYDVVIDASGLAPGTHEGWVRFSAGPTGGTTSVRFTVYVIQGFYPVGSLVKSIGSTSQASDLAWSIPVATVDGSTAQWSVVSNSPYLGVIRSSGITGVDPIELVVDPAILALPDRGHVMSIDLSIDRQGVPPLTVQLSLWNYIPSVRKVSPATLAGDHGRIYVDGFFYLAGSNPITEGTLRVSGARLVGAQFISDPRFIGDVSVLAIDVDSVSAGQPISIAVDSALAPTQVSVQTRPILQSPMTYAPLPLGRYRPPQYSPGLESLFFYGMDSVFAWRHSAGAWSLEQSSLPGVIDVALSPDEEALIATESSKITALDPGNFALLSSGLLVSDPAQSFDSGSPVAARALAFSADGRALASFSRTGVDGVGHGAEWICSRSANRDVPSLTTSPEVCDPGIQVTTVGGSIGSGLTRSVNGGAVIGVDANGRRQLYRSSLRYWTLAPSFGAGSLAAAISDDGSRLIRSDGMVIDGFDSQLGSLPSVLPLTHVAGGYGLTSNGRFGLVYGYALTGTGAAQQASDASIWVIDLVDVASTGVAGAPVVAVLPLASPVGCTTALAVGEECRHAASITVAPGDGSVFVLGPRGVAVVPMPASVSSPIAKPSERPSSKATRRAMRPLHAPALMSPNSPSTLSAP